MTKYIHIHAKCTRFEIFEQVPEKKAVKRLEKIRENFMHFQQIGMNDTTKKLAKKFKAFNHYQDDHLVVKTCVVNPEIPFNY